MVSEVIERGGPIQVRRVIQRKAVQNADFCRASYSPAVSRTPSVSSPNSRDGVQSTATFSCSVPTTRKIILDICRESVNRSTVKPLP